MGADLWDLLYSHLGDTDGHTVAACLCSLEDIYSHEVGVVVTKKLGTHLIQSIHTFTPAVQRVLCQFLLKYSPKTKADVFTHLNALDPILISKSSLALTLCCLDVFTHFTKDLPKVQLKAYTAAWTTIKNHLPRERSQECISALIDYLGLIEFPSSLFEMDYSLFFCKDDEPQYLSEKKISFLCKLITEQNFEAILSELNRCVRRVGTVAGVCVMRGFACAMGRMTELEASCAHCVSSLMYIDNLNLLNSLVQVLYFRYSYVQA